jgi:hypothetical protein
LGVVETGVGEASVAVAWPVAAGSWVVSLETSVRPAGGLAFRVELRAVAAPAAAGLWAPAAALASLPAAALAAAELWAAALSGWGRSLTTTGALE